MKKTIAFVLGIRPDIIRAALIIRQLREYDQLNLVFIWTGQHYSDNLKDIFFRELGVAPAELDLRAAGDSDASTVGSIVSRLYDVLVETKPVAAVFLGDTNTTTGAIAAGLLNIPIVHIEGCMRSYDWRMPEEKYRTIIDHLADVIYAYFDEYKEQGVREGLNPRNIVVVGNPIVDILEHYYFAQRTKFDSIASDLFFSTRSIERSKYYLATCHRRENVETPAALISILELFGAAPYPVYFPASYRTQRILAAGGYSVPNNVIVVDPLGYDEFLALLVNSRGAITDSGTIVEEACVLGIPTVQMRKSTERPQVYDLGASVKFDPLEAKNYPSSMVFAKVEYLFGRTWDRAGLGDGQSSRRIAEDLLRRAMSDDFRGHEPDKYAIPIDRSYREDGIAM